MRNLEHVGVVGRVEFHMPQWVPPTVTHTRSGSCPPSIDWGRWGSSWLGRLVTLWGILGVEHGDWAGSIGKGENGDESEDEPDDQMVS